MTCSFSAVNYAGNGTHAPAPGRRSGHQQTKGTGDRHQTSSVQGQPFPDGTTYPEFQENGWNQYVTDDEGNIVEVFEGAVAQPGDWEGTDEQEPGHDSLDAGVYEYADGELEGDDDDDQVFSYLQEDEGIGNGLEGEVEYVYEELYVQEDGTEVEELEVEYTGNEPAQPVGDDEGGQEPSHPQDEGDADADADSGEGDSEQEASDDEPEYSDSEDD